MQFHTRVCQIRSDDVDIRRVLVRRGGVFVVKQTVARSDGQIVKIDAVVAGVIRADVAEKRYGNAAHGERRIVEHDVQRAARNFRRSRELNRRSREHESRAGVERDVCIFADETNSADERAVARDFQLRRIRNCAARRAVGQRGAVYKRFPRVSQRRSVQRQVGSVLNRDSALAGNIAIPNAGRSRRRRRIVENYGSERVGGNGRRRHRVDDVSVENDAPARVCAKREFFLTDFAQIHEREIRAGDVPERGGDGAVEFLLRLIRFCQIERGGNGVLAQRDRAVRQQIYCADVVSDNDRSREGTAGVVQVFQRDAGMRSRRLDCELVQRIGAEAAVLRFTADIDFGEIGGKSVEHEQTVADNGKLRQPGNRSREALRRIVVRVHFDREAPGIYVHRSRAGESGKLFDGAVEIQRDIFADVDYALEIVAHAFVCGNGYLFCPRSFKRERSRAGKRSEIAQRERCQRIREAERCVFLDVDGDRKRREKSRADFQRSRGNVHRKITDGNRVVRIVVRGDPCRSRAGFFQSASADNSAVGKRQPRVCHGAIFADRHFDGAVFKNDFSGETVNRFIARRCAGVPEHERSRCRPCGFVRIFAGERERSLARKRAADDGFFARRNIKLNRSTVQIQRGLRSRGQRVEIKNRLATFGSCGNASERQRNAAVEHERRNVCNRNVVEFQRFFRVGSGIAVRFVGNDAQGVVPVGDAGNIRVFHHCSGFAKLEDERNIFRERVGRGRNRRFRGVEIDFEIAALNFHGAGEKFRCGNRQRVVPEGNETAVRADVAGNPRVQDERSRAVHAGDFSAEHRFHGAVARAARHVRTAVAIEIQSERRARAFAEIDVKRRSFGRFRIDCADQPAVPDDERSREILVGGIAAEQGVAEIDDAVADFEHHAGAAQPSPASGNEQISGRIVGVAGIIRSRLRIRVRLLNVRKLAVNRQQRAVFNDNPRRVLNRVPVDTELAGCNRRRSRIGIYSRERQRFRALFRKIQRAGKRSREFCGFHAERCDDFGVGHGCRERHAVGAADQRQISRRRDEFVGFIVRIKKRDERVERFVVQVRKPGVRIRRLQIFQRSRRDKLVPALDVQICGGGIRAVEIGANARVAARDEVCHIQQRSFRRGGKLRRGRIDEVRDVFDGESFFQPFRHGFAGAEKRIRRGRAVTEIVAASVVPGIGCGGCICGTRRRTVIHFLKHAFPVAIRSRCRVEPGKRAVVDVRVGRVNEIRGIFQIRVRVIDGVDSAARGSRCIFERSQNALGGRSRKIRFVIRRIIRCREIFAVFPGKTA